ncbi:MAG: PilZ domain-containing protein [Novosphingobium sp.]|nr:PilZ domain-containing protein [Novosphingobium sp.]MCP5401017.1 PilZ domain-containing protein [Novosphingobium sp.]
MGELKRTVPAEFGTKGERRIEDRTKTTVYRPILFETAELSGFCLLRDLSAGGMMGVVYTTLAAAQPITIEFHPDLGVPGMIAWSSDERVGVRFDADIDVAHTIALLGKTHAEGWIKRAPRLAMACEGEAVTADRTLPFRLHDISQRGARLELAGVRTGEEVSMRLAGLEPHKGLVRWVRDGNVGLNFLRPYGLEELARWAVSRQSR